MARSDQTAWVVEVLEGPAAGARIPLEGRAMPHRAGAGGAVSFGIQQRTQLTWYPGNPVASQNVFGSTLPPTTIDGTWQDRYLGEDRALDLVDLFHELVEQGAQVRVTWGGLTYQGLVQAVAFRPGVPTGGLADLGWAITFEWNQRGAVPARRIVGSSSQTLRDRLATGATTFGDLRELADQLSGAVASLHGLTRTSSIAFRGELQDLADEGDAALEAMSSAAVVIGQQVEAPRRALEDAVAATDRTLDVAADYADLVGDVWPGALQASDDPGLLLLDALERIDVLEGAFSAMEGAFEAAVALAALVRPVAQTTVRPVRGSDLRYYALLYYGDADLWGRLAAANGLDGSSLIPSDVEELLIPLELSASLEVLREDL